MEVLQASPMPFPPLPGSAIAPVERAPRTMTTLLVGKLLCGAAGDHPCRIRNLSATGMLVETSQPLLPGQPVTVELRGGDRLDAAVAWAASGRAGLRFLVPASVDAILANARPHDAVQSFARLWAPARGPSAAS
ncbi:PilZ domain-containing protein [Sphingomonas hengshuiensis]|uniref:PilZ domain-containing protein n=1 Tax=Sphingomonas hengshuiensis TaxID=1609977 RepID=UPI000A7ADAB5|nr:PilZ domain-containing protein [Sphingomonas hengshuiensis]